MDQKQREESYAFARRFYKNLLACEKLSPDALQRHQEEVATTFLTQVQSLTSFYNDRLAPVRAADGSINFDRWEEVPLLTKSEVRDHLAKIRSRHLPQHHGKIVYTESSGSGGQSLRLPATQLAELAHHCALFRHMHNHGVDWSRNYAMIRANQYAPTAPGPIDPETLRWGPPWINPGERGARHSISALSHADILLDWLREREPVYVNTTPGVVRKLAERIARTGEEPPKITKIFTGGEIVDQDLRDLCSDTLKCRIADAYAAAECGIIAAECPVSGGYHLQSELAIVDVVNDEGRKCQVGEPGRVAVTPLFNLALPLIRYVLDDYVSLTTACPSGRPAPLIGKIHGRRNSLFSFTDGTFGQLPVDRRELDRHMGGCSWQLHQISRERTELRYQQCRPSVAINQNGAADVVRMAAGKSVQVIVTEVPAIGQTPGAKFGALKSDIGS